MNRGEIDEFGRAYLKLALEIDRLYEGYLDAYWGPDHIQEEVETGPVPSPIQLQENHNRLVDLIPEDDPHRYRYLKAQVEAMVQRKPVFALYNNDLRRDYLLMIPHATEMMVVAGSAAELAAQIRRLRSSPELADPLVERAYAWASAQTWQSVAHTYLNLYQESGHGVQL